MNSSQLSIANNEQTKKEYRKIIPFPIASKKKNRNKHNKGSERLL
jgi:hypothetical protein